MRKKDEQGNPQSCFNRARPNELIFVLLARDRAAPAAIRAWVRERLRLGKNAPGDDQTTEALIVALEMEENFHLDHGGREAYS